MIQATDDLRIVKIKPLISPVLLASDLPLNAATASLVINTRAAAGAVSSDQDDRLLVIVGPCSIHDPVAALEYGAKLAEQVSRLSDDLVIIMRVYFEKPRTIVGWKGLINDPDLDGSYDINKGLHLARKLLVDLAQIGVPAATEFLDTIIPQFLSDIVAWGAIGARTTESQIHRELASGLSMPIGFKNGTDGNIQIAIDALRSARHPHAFLGVSKMGVPVILETRGNEHTHVILRGAQSGPNYSAADVAKVCKSLKAHQLNPQVMVDCSHGNSNKDHLKQIEVAADIAQQLTNGSNAIFGVMLESNLIAGKQALTPGKPLVYGQSITDACISWEDTVGVLERLALAVQARRKSKQGMRA